jgi:superfamily II DNA or RNA helicase
MTRAHLYYNDEVIMKAADLANKSYEFLGQQVLILVEEVEQFGRLLPFLKHPVKFAHGPLTKQNIGDVPEAYQKVDVKELVEDFNARKFPFLVGTSCISTGTDIQPAEHVIYLRGGKSEVQVRQSVGRGTRRIEGQGKTCFNFTDFVVEVDAIPSATCVEKHAKERAKIYADIYPNSVEEISYG